MTGWSRRWRSSWPNKRLFVLGGEADLPAGVLIGAIVRGGQVISPRGDTIIEPNDRVVLFAASEVVRKVEKMFSVRLEFF